jgi:branched-subunit amino acid aminotransferase/4-amino-4-deoxychorismate lyase
LYKTTQREVYDSAFLRGGSSHPEVLLHTATHLLETTTSNIALHIPARNGEADWLTPRLQGESPFLDGVVRRELLKRGLIREGEVQVEDWERCKMEGRGVVGFNGLR